MIILVSIFSIFLVCIGVLVGYFNWNVLHDKTCAAAVRAGGAAFGMVWVFSVIAALTSARGFCSLIGFGLCETLAIFFLAFITLLGLPLLLLGTASALKCNAGKHRALLTFFGITAWLIWAASIRRMM